MPHRCRGEWNIRLDGQRVGGWCAPCTSHSMNPILFPFLLTSGFLALSSCDRPLTSKDNSQYREGKSGASSGTIEDDKTDNPTPYPAADKEKTK